MWRVPEVLGQLGQGAPVDTVAFSLLLSNEDFLDATVPAVALVRFLYRLPDRRLKECDAEPGAQQCPGNSLRDWIDSERFQAARR